MGILIVLNIILLILLTIVVLYLFKQKKDFVKSVCVNGDKYKKNESDEHKQKNNKKSERVFEGRFITDEEYQQMKKSKRSDISILMEEVNNEYEYLKELSNGWTEGNNKR
jgi:hypothetical protein